MLVSAGICPTTSRLTGLATLLLAQSAAATTGIDAQMASSSQPNLPQPNYDILRLEDHRPAAVKAGSDQSSAGPHQAAKLEQLSHAHANQVGPNAAADEEEVGSSEAQRSDSEISELAATATQHPGDVGPPAASGTSVMLAGANFGGPTVPDVDKSQATTESREAGAISEPPAPEPTDSEPRVSEREDSAQDSTTEQQNFEQSLAEEEVEAEASPAYQAPDASPENGPESGAESTKGAELEPKNSEIAETDAVDAEPQSAADESSASAEDTGGLIASSTTGQAPDNEADETAVVPGVPHSESCNSEEEAASEPAEDLRAESSDNTMQLSVVSAEGDDAEAINEAASESAEDVVELAIARNNVPAANTLASAEAAEQGAEEPANLETSDSAPEEAPDAETEVCEEEGSEDAAEIAEPSSIDDEMPTEGMAFIEELEKKHNQVLDELDALNARIESVLESYLGSRSDGKSDDSGTSTKAA